MSIDMFRVRQVDEMADQVDLADLRQWRRRVGQGGTAGRAVVGRHIARRQPMATPAGMAEFEEQVGGLGVHWMVRALTRF